MFFRKPSVSGPVDFIVAGFGNPGKKYEGTRHNAGFMVIEALSAQFGVKVDRIKFKSYTAQAEIGGVKILLLMPQTFMNLSGDAVGEAMRFYKLPPERVLLIFDDISLPPGSLRVRRKGSDGGQKGMRSVIERTGSDEFPRIKIGIGAKPHPEYDLSAWVLSRFSKEESAALLSAVESACGAVRMITAGDIDGAMGKYN